MTMQVSVVGAFDRFNYGDILFAQIAREILTRQVPDANIHYYGLRAADLRPEGGVRTSPLRDLYRIPLGDEFHVVWVAGGEVLSARWHLMTEHLMSPRTARIFRRVRRRFGTERVDRWCQRLSRVPTSLPWVINPDRISGHGRVQVAYNSVGGIKSGNLPDKIRHQQTEALSKARWLSVRDSTTKARLLETGVPEPFLSPDSAVAMDMLRSVSELDAAHARVLARIAAKGGRSHPDRDYLCLQCGLNYFKGEEDALLAAIHKIHETQGMDVVAFAIGRAAGHDDQVVAARLAERLAGESWFHQAPDDLTVLEIMALISGASCYVGTSLHGYITAFVHARPRVGLHPRVAKLVGFRDDWDLPTMPAGMPVAQASEAVAAAMKHDPEAMRRRAGEVSARYRSDMGMMLSRLGLV